jgi:hypothetical protein
MGTGVSNEVSRASMATFNREELECMVKTAEQYGVKVAAHSTERLSMSLLRHIGVHSIEHGFNIGHGLSYSSLKDEMRLFAQSKTIWVVRLHLTRYIDKFETSTSRRLPHTILSGKAGNGTLLLPRSKPLLTLEWTILRVAVTQAFLLTEIMPWS